MIIEIIFRSNGIEYDRAYDFLSIVNQTEFYLFHNQKEIVRTIILLSIWKEVEIYSQCEDYFFHFEKNMIIKLFLWARLHIGVQFRSPSTFELYNTE